MAICVPSFIINKQERVYLLFALIIWLIGKEVKLNFSLIPLKMDAFQWPTLIFIIGCDGGTKSQTSCKRMASLQQVSFGAYAKMQFRAHVTFSDFVTFSFYFIFQVIQ